MSGPAWVIAAVDFLLAIVFCRSLLRAGRRMRALREQSQVWDERRREFIREEHERRKNVRLGGH